MQSCHGAPHTACHNVHSFAAELLAKLEQSLPGNIHNISQDKLLHRGDGARSIEDLAAILERAKSSRRCLLIRREAGGYSAFGELLGRLSSVLCRSLSGSQDLVFPNSWQLLLPCYDG